MGGGHWPGTWFSRWCLPHICGFVADIDRGRVNWVCVQRWQTVQNSDRKRSCHQLYRVRMLGRAERPHTAATGAYWPSGLGFLISHPDFQRDNAKVVRANLCGRRCDRWDIGKINGMHNMPSIPVGSLRYALDLKWRRRTSLKLRCRAKVVTVQCHTRG